MNVNAVLPCRSCRAADSAAILSLGRMPLANRLLDADKLFLPEPRFPLDLVFCANCSLVQITETVPPEELFLSYPYFSSYSDTMLASSRDLVSRLCADRALNAAHLVVEIGSNDGYLLQFYKDAGVRVLGIDPAVNVANVAQEHRGVPTISVFFGEAVAQHLTADGVRADVIHANNVLAHVADLNGVVRGIATLLADDGVAVLEVPYVRDLVERGEFDTIYHEHLCYFSLSALRLLLHRHGLVLQHVERLPIHGGSLRLFVGRRGAEAASVQEQVDEERTLGMHHIEFYRPLQDKAETIKSALRTMLENLAHQGKRIAAYGAAAKGTTLLEYCGIGAELVEYVVDRNVHKQGKYMPGTRLLIRDPNDLLADKPDYLVILAWNFADEIMAQQAAYRAGGGRFILPSPTVQIVD